MVGRQIVSGRRISRAVFAEKLPDAVGVTPMEYLLKWRMALAKDRLRHSTESLQEIASAAGYKSASSFGTAFSHRFGCSANAFRRSREVSHEVSSPDLEISVAEGSER